MMHVSNFEQVSNLINKVFLCKSRQLKLFVAMSDPCAIWKSTHGRLVVTCQDESSKHLCKLSLGMFALSKLAVSDMCQCYI